MKDEGCFERNFPPVIFSCHEFLLLLSSLTSKTIHLLPAPWRIKNEENSSSDALCCVELLLMMRTQ